MTSPNQPNLPLDGGVMAPEIMLALRQLLDSEVGVHAKNVSILKDQAIGAATTRFKHGRKGGISGWMVVSVRASTATGVTEVSRDDTNLDLVAAVACTADIIVW